MQAAAFFTVIFCGIFGAVMLLRIFYGAAVSYLSGKHKKKTDLKGGGER